MNPTITIALVAVIAALTLNSFRLQSEIDKLRRVGARRRQVWYNE